VARLKLNGENGAGVGRTESAARRLRELAGKALGAAGIVTFVAGCLLLYRQQFTESGFYRPEYEGRVVHKSLTGHETQEGSRVERKLLVEGGDGVRFEVRVGPEVYERAEVGMWIRVKNAQVELTRPVQQRPAVGPAR
jgi:hypothetical protein